jgi:hypothetical protein
MPGRQVPEVAFFLDDPRPLAELEGLDPERDWRELVRGERVWILKTFLHLRAAGHPVHLVGAAPREGIVVFHAKQRRALARSLAAQGFRVPRAVLVGVRGDLRQPLIADFEILQSSRWAGPRRFAVPHWPQGGLVPRDPARGERIENVAFKGFAANLAAPFRSPAWAEALARRGLTWRADSVAFAGLATDETALDWNDYSEVDLVVAVRPPRRRLWTSKPATKLVNAWRAGVPAVLGPEWAYRELRQGPLDYLEAASAEEALAAIDLLRESPDLYRDMALRGLERAEEVTVEKVTARWAEVLFELVPERLAADRGLARLRRWPLPVRALARRARRLAAGRPAR